MFNKLKRWYRSTVLRDTRISFQLWQQSTVNLFLFNRLSTKQLTRLRKLTGLFLHEKHFTGAAGMELTEKMLVQIAAQACLLILNRNFSDFDGWHEIIVYPDAFIVEYEHIDEAGVIHSAERTLGGEAWGRGPVILSWVDADPDRQKTRHFGSNVVLHEFAHKLDMLNGVANGMPVLNNDMKREDWTRIFSHAYDRLLRELEHGRHVSIDPYAGQSPAEFFAVVSEYFFMAPEYLNKHYPGIYGEMSLYYRQNPLTQA
ncbi:MAG: M90 family metallopeptidase [Pseudomonadota bacterium]|nr:M90 family metallopeptidase [Pseudomonadota bacterium]